MVFIYLCVLIPVLILQSKEEAIERIYMMADLQSADFHDIFCPFPSESDIDIDNISVADLSFSELDIDSLFNADIEHLPSAEEPLPIVEFSLLTNEHDTFGVGEIQPTFGAHFSLPVASDYAVDVSTPPTTVTAYIKEESEQVDEGIVKTEQVPIDVNTEQVDVVVKTEQVDVGIVKTEQSDEGNTAVWNHEAADVYQDDGLSFVLEEACGFAEEVPASVEASPMIINPGDHLPDFLSYEVPQLDEQSVVAIDESAVSQNDCSTGIHATDMNSLLELFEEISQSKFSDDFEVSHYMDGKLTKCQSQPVSRVCSATTSPAPTPPTTPPPELLNRIRSRNVDRKRKTALIPLPQPAKRSRTKGSSAPATEANGNSAKLQRTPSRSGLATVSEYSSKAVPTSSSGPQAIQSKPSTSGTLLSDNEAAKLKLQNARLLQALDSGIELSTVLKSPETVSLLMAPIGSEKALARSNTHGVGSSLQSLIKPTASNTPGTSDNRTVCPVVSNVVQVVSTKSILPTDVSVGRNNVPNQQPSSSHLATSLLPVASVLKSPSVPTNYTKDPANPPTEPDTVTDSANTADDRYKSTYSILTSGAEKLTGEARESVLDHDYVRDCPRRVIVDDGELDNNITSPIKTHTQKPLHRTHSLPEFSKSHMSVSQLGVKVGNKSMGQVSCSSGPVQVSRTNKPVVQNITHSVSASSHSNTPSAQTQLANSSVASKMHQLQSVPVASNVNQTKTTPILLKVSQPSVLPDLSKNKVIASKVILPRSKSDLSRALNTSIAPQVIKRNKSVASQLAPASVSPIAPVAASADATAIVKNIAALVEKMLPNATQPVAGHTLTVTPVPQKPPQVKLVQNSTEQLSSNGSIQNNGQLPQQNEMLLKTSQVKLVQKSTEQLSSNGSIQNNGQLPQQNGILLKTSRVTANMTGNMNTGCSSEQRFQLKSTRPVGFSLHGQQLVALRDSKQAPRSDIKCQQTTKRPLLNLQLGGNYSTLEDGRQNTENSVAKKSPHDMICSNSKDLHLSKLKDCGSCENSTGQVAKKQLEAVRAFNKKQSKRCETSIICENKVSMSLPENDKEKSEKVMPEVVSNEYNAQKDPSNFLRVSPQQNSLQNDVLYSMPLIDVDDPPCTDVCDRIITPVVTEIHSPMATDPTVDTENHSPVHDSRSEPVIPVDNTLSPVHSQTEQTTEKDVTSPCDRMPLDAPKEGNSTNEYGQNEFTAMWEEMQEAELSRLNPNMSTLKCTEDSVPLRDQIESSDIKNKQNARNSKNSRGSSRRGKNNKHGKSPPREAVSNGFSKLPSYISEISIPSQTGRKELRAEDIEGMSAYDFIPVDQVSCEKEKEPVLDKIPQYFSCFTNSTKYDAATAYSKTLPTVEVDSPPEDALIITPKPNSKPSSQACSPARSMCSSRSRKHSKSRARKGYRRRNYESSESSRSRSRSRSPRQRRRSPSVSGSSRSSFRSRSHSRSRTSSRSWSHTGSNTSRSRSRSKSRSRSPLSRSRYNSKRRHSRLHPDSLLRDRSGRGQRKRPEKPKENSTKWNFNGAQCDEERRKIVYVGRIPDGYTRKELHRCFERYGRIKEVSVHFREAQDNYGFVTYHSHEDATVAIERGKKDFNKRFDLSFGGRREFCVNDYADLDGNLVIKEEYNPMPAKASFDFDELLRQAKRQQKK